MTVPQTTLVGSIRNFLLVDPEVVALVGQKIQPGRISTGFTSAQNASVVPSSMPYIVLNWIAARYQMNLRGQFGGQTNIFQAILQITCFAGQYDNCEALGALVDSKITAPGVCFSASGIMTYLTPQTGVPLLDKQKNEQGQDVWFYPLRYGVVLPKQSLSVGLMNVLNGSGALRFPAFSSSGSDA